MTARYVSRQQCGAVGIAKIDGVSERHQRLGGGFVGGVDDLDDGPAVPRQSRDVGQLSQLLDRFIDPVARIWRRHDARREIVRVERAFATGWRRQVLDG